MTPVRVLLALLAAVGVLIVDGARSRRARLR